MGGPLRRRHLVDATDEQQTRAGPDADADTGAVSAPLRLRFTDYLRVTDALGQTDGAVRSVENHASTAICGDSTWHLDGATE